MAKMNKKMLRKIGEKNKPRKKAKTTMRYDGTYEKTGTGGRGEAAKRAIKSSPLALQKYKALKQKGAPEAEAIARAMDLYRKLKAE